jgi:hypothetical protein
MARRTWLSVIVLVAVASGSRAVILVDIWDPVDDPALIDAVSGQKPVKEFATEIEALEKTLFANDKEEIEKLLGKPAPMPEKGYAIPVGQRRTFMISGLRYADERLNNDHTAYYPVGDFAGIAVAYGVNGTSPQYAVLYFKVDAAFPKLKEMGAKAVHKPGEPKKTPAVTRKHAIDVDHWEQMKPGMNKQQIAELFSAPPGDYAPGTDYLTRRWGWHRGGDGKVRDTLEWRSEKGRIVVEFDESGNFVTSEFYRAGRDPVTNVAKRLKWDREKFDKLKRYVEGRRAALLAGAADGGQEASREPSSGQSLLQNPSSWAIAVTALAVASLGMITAWWLRRRAQVRSKGKGAYPE